MSIWEMFKDFVYGFKVLYQIISIDNGLYILYLKILYYTPVLSILEEYWW